MRYAIVTDRPNLLAWEYACLQALAESGAANLEVAVCAAAAGTPEDLAFRQPAERLFQASNPPSLSTSCAVRSLSVDVIDWDASATTAMEHKAALAAHSLDFALVFGGLDAGRACGDATRFGAWTFLVHDLEDFTAPLPCFWEMFTDRDGTGASLLKLGDPAVAGTVLKHGFFPVQRDSLAASCEAVFPFLNHWPINVCREIEAGTAAYLKGSPKAWPKTRYGFPSAKQARAFAAMVAKHQRRARWRQRHFLVDWNIGRTSAAASSFIGKDQKAQVALLLPARSGRYVADPCIVRVGSKTAIFCEEYPYQTGVGFISAFEVDRKKASSPKPAIEEAFHLSYPQVFKHNEILYCMPEAGAGRRVALYRCIEFPYEWKFERVLIDNFAAVDSTLLHDANGWWLFCTSGECGRRAFNSHLYIWHAEDLYGPWMPHALNPVKVDVRSARPAGQFFAHEGQWYRPAQDCSRIYGGLIHINRIDSLSETEFAEKVVGTIRPPEGPYHEGIHTISACDGMTIVDVQRYVFNPRSIVTATWLALKSAAREAGVSEASLEKLKRHLKRGGTNAFWARRPRPHRH